MLRPILFATLIVAAMAPATTAVADDQPPHSLQPGSTALMFGLSSSSDRLVAFDGTLISVKKQWSRRTALRLGLDLDLSTLEHELAAGEEAQLYGPEDTLSTWSEDSRLNDEDALDLALDAVFLRYAGPDRTLHLFYGAGPLVAYGHDKKTDRDSGTDNGGEDTERTTRELTSWRVGLRTVLGVEWFAAHWFSLQAEYRLDIAYSHLKDEHDRVRTSSDEDGVVTTERVYQGAVTTTSWDLGSGGAVCAASFYF